jgi:diguanylate cyclase (GGDEF)-like protein
MRDELTGLPNRRFLREQLSAVLGGQPASVLLLDLDRFKDVNDTLGHVVGDRLLCLVGERLQQAAPGTALVAHIGGDEFAILLPGAGDLEARACASWVERALSRPFELEGISVATQASIGVAVAERGVEGATALRWADVAMYAAKENRTSVEVYRPELDTGDVTRLSLLADLRDAVASNALAVHYQVKVDLTTARVEGVEALARWQHPTHGPVGPDEFIPLAEQSSLITPLTMLVLRTALRDVAAWRTTRPGFTVAVNISPRSLLDPTFVDEVSRALAAASVAPDALTLEITENSLMSDPDRAVGALRRLGDLGIRLSVDDLGTGYSSLAYLRRLPIHEVKIDRSFLSEFPHASAQAVVGAIVDLGHRLGHAVVAEGVEDADVYAALAALGCDSAQGFWLGRPVGSEELSRLLNGWNPPGTRTLAAL